MNGLKFWRNKGRDKDFPWFLRQLDERLVVLQEFKGGVAFGHAHVIREYGEEFSVALNDEGIAEALEWVGNSPEPIYRRFRGLLKAEQARRRNEKDRQSTCLMRLTLIVAAIGTAVTLFPVARSIALGE